MTSRYCGRSARSGYVQRTEGWFETREARMQRLNGCVLVAGVAIAEEIRDRDEQILLQRVGLTRMRPEKD